MTAGQNNAGKVLGHMSQMYQQYIPEPVRNNAHILALIALFVFFYWFYKKRKK